MQGRTLLVLNCHEAWVYQLGVLGFRLDIVVGLKGTYKKLWDEHMRPLPAGSRVISLAEALQSDIDYYCLIAHNVADLLDLRSRPEPRLLVIHSTLEGRMAEEKSIVDAARMKAMVREYLGLVGGHAVAVSLLKGTSWGFTEDIVPFCADPADYLAYTGETPHGLRICNFVDSRRKILLWDFHERAFAGLPVKIVGHNPGMSGVRAASNWDELKRDLRSHRFHIHTADPRLEDGYNMATVEAMAAGMPILGNRHPGSPIEHGVSGFLSDDAAELRNYAIMLLENRDLAVEMGRQARKTATERFSVGAFREGFTKSIETARRKRHAIEASQQKLF